jgi:hypothetical protein
MAFMHHTHHVLDDKYIPKTAIDIHVLWEMEMQTFLYAGFEEHLKTDRGKLLDS